MVQCRIYGSPPVAGRPLSPYRHAKPKDSTMFKALFWCALAFALVMALLPHPPHLPIDSFGDKFEHMLAFATLSILGATAYPAMPLPRLGERLSFLGAIIEVLQSIPSLHRDCDIKDWIADTIAVIVALGIIHLMRQRRLKPA
jgi:VanZ family protein